MRFRLPLLALLLTTRLVVAAVLPDDWAFQPLRTFPEHSFRWDGRGMHPIDRWLAEAKVPVESDRRTLMRRLNYVLVGLPPSPEELEGFLADTSPQAWERVVDRLLASPRHGERWARHWLDIARFGESQGFEYDRIREHAWRYRDYVINAFNADKRYDQFIREQLAGDVGEPVSAEGIIATGFLVAGPWDQAGSGAASPSVRAMVREAELEDMVGTVGQSFLGVTLNCARCHDHKFDPIPTRDYYRVKAVFQGVRHGDRPVVTKAEEQEREQRAAGQRQRLSGIDSRLAELEAVVRSRALARITSAPGPSSLMANPAPLARWTFAQDARDVVGNLAARLEGGAVITNGRLQLDGQRAYAETGPIPWSLGPKTLEAWITLADLQQGGGAVLSVETLDGNSFDALVFGERQPRRWMAGSEFYRRTRDLDGVSDETASRDELIHVAVTYAADHTVSLYRNGQPLGRPYRWTNDFAALDRFPTGGARLLFGKRHTGGGRNLLAGSIEEARVYDLALTPEQIRESFRSGPAAATLTREQILAAATEAERAELSRWRQEAESLRGELNRKVPAKQAYAANPQAPGQTFVLHRGEPDKPRQQVQGGALAAVRGLSAELGLSDETPEAERRRRFADWVANPGNPLTARTIVNRVWQHHFGRGLVASPSDLGKMGDRPVHPELLDWLAGWFVAPEGANWSLKKLHRLLVTSAAWRSRSDVAGDSPRFQMRRLEVEAVRDAMLAVSGELNLAAGGPGFRNFEQRGNGNQNEYFATDPTGPEFNRRTIYRLSAHSARDPLLDSLDCPEFSTRTPVRPNTTTPLQALSLMNGSFGQRQSERLAARVEREVGKDRLEQLRRLWLVAYSREVTPEELAVARSLAERRGLASMAWAVLNSSEFLFLR